MKFSQILCNLMDSKHISAYKMSKDTGISDRLIGYWKKGEKLPNAENLIIIANYFNTSIDCLLGRTAERSIESKDNHDKIHQIVSRLDDEQTSFLLVLLTKLFGGVK